MSTPLFDQRKCELAAVATLAEMGYMWFGGERWKSKAECDREMFGVARPACPCACHKTADTWLKQHCDRCECFLKGVNTAVDRETLAGLHREMRDETSPAAPDPRFASDPEWDARERESLAYRVQGVELDLLRRCEELRKEFAARFQSLAAQLGALVHKAVSEAQPESGLRIRINDIEDRVVQLQDLAGRLKELSIAANAVRQRLDHLEDRVAGIEKNSHVLHEEVNQIRFRG